MGIPLIVFSVVLIGVFYFIDSTGGVVGVPWIFVQFGLSWNGVSGSCFALLVAWASLRPWARMWPLPVTGRNLGLGVIVASFLLLLMRPELSVPGLSQIGRMMVALAGEGIFQISHACYFGGAIAGWWCARGSV